MKKDSKGSSLVQVIPSNEPIDVLLSDLEIKYKDIEEEQNTERFYLKIADYGKYLIDQKDALDDLISPLYQESSKDLDNYKKACDTFWEEWKVFASDLIEQAEKAGIKDDSTSPFISQIHELKGKLKEKPDYDEEYIGWYFRPYRELLERFKQAGKIDLISEKHLKNVNGIEYPILEDTYDKTDEEWNKFKRLRELKVWWAHYQIMRLTHGILGLENSEKYFDNDNVIDQIYKHEFESVAKGNTHTAIISKKKFEEWVKRLHNYLHSRLKAYQTMKPLADSAIKSASAMREQYHGTIIATLNNLKKSFPSELISKLAEDIQEKYEGILPMVSSDNSREALIMPIKSSNDILLEQLIDEIREVKTILKTQKEETDTSSPILSSYRLLFYPADGLTLYRESQYKFKGKAKALLAFLNISKNTPFALEDIQKGCNKMINNPKHHFKGDKDTRDTVSYIRKMLNVNDGEYFPIQKIDSYWKWLA